MNIENQFSNYTLPIKINRKDTNRNMVNFAAKLQDIQTETIKASEAKKLCPGKTNFITAIVDFFNGLKDKLPQNFEFKLGEKNNLSEELSELKGQLGGKELTLGQLNVALNEDSFNCGPNSTCSCGKGMNKGQFLAFLFEKVLKLDNPEKIEFNK